MGEHQVLVAGVEFDQGGGSETSGTELLPVMVGKDPQHEVFPQQGVAQAAILLHRQQGVGRHQRLGEQAHPLLGTTSVIATIGRTRIDAHPLHAATGRLGTEDIAGDKIELTRLLFTKGNELVSDIEAEGGQAIAVPGDIKHEQVAKALVDTAVDRFGGLDIAFNNAGMVGEIKPITEMSLDAWHEMLDTNLASAFLGAKYQVPAMLARGGGSLIFTSSRCAA